jgi:hypothetical protein
LTRCNVADEEISVDREVPRCQLTSRERRGSTRVFAES